ncbi:MAG: hypothetical protein ABIT05_01475 [Chitinophagaceae bacterium]
MINLINYLRFLKFSTTPKPVVPTDMISEERFVQLTAVVIDNFEGGYYHPDMKIPMSLENQKKLGDSGETMFGLDRKYGSALSVYPEWAFFWAIVDEARARYKWKHYYRGGPVEPRLKELAALIMFRWFSQLFHRHLTQKAQQAVINDDRLIIHFSYASWNGEGWFKLFALALNNAVNGNFSEEVIFQKAIVARTNAGNSVIRQQGARMLALFKKMQTSNG